MKDLKEFSDSLLKNFQISIYTFFSIFLSNMNVLILVVIFTAVDFYFVKNIAGRLLLGLYWGTLQNDSDKWIYLSKGEEP